MKVSIEDTVVEIDDEIVDIVQALNAGGLSTRGSCSGHGQARGFVLLADERTLIVLPAPTASTWAQRELEFNEKIKLPVPPKEHDCSYCYPLENQPEVNDD